MNAEPAAPTGMTAVQSVILFLRVTLEAGVVGALAYWGAHAGTSTISSVLLAVAAPAVGFGIWGALDFRFTGRYAEPLRLIEELVISGLAAAALYVAGQQLLGIGLAVVSVVYHAFVYGAGERLLRHPRSVG
jgi:hypothetical protein